NSNQIASTSVMTLSSGTFDLNNNNEEMASLVFNNGTIANNTGFLALDSSGTALSINDGLSFPGQLNLTGASGGEISYVGTTTMATIEAIDLAGVTRTFNVANGTDAVDLSITGEISGAGGVSKTGAGVLDFSVSNSYTGAT